MKIAYFMAIVISALLLIGGCPSDAGDDDGADAAEAQIPAIEQPVQSGEDSADAAAIETDASAQSTGEPVDGEAGAALEDAPPVDESGASEAEGETAGTVTGTFDLTGLRIGATPPAYRLYYDSRPEIQLFPTWVEQNSTGLVAANLASGSVTFAEVAYFLDGELVGVMRHVEEAAVNYADFTNELERRYGPPGGEPPRWARVAPFFAGYEQPDPGLVMKYWGNSQTREVFFAARNNELSSTDYMLCDVDRFDVVARQIQDLAQPR